MISFRKRVKIARGVSLNFSKSGVSTSFGPRGAKITVGKNGVYLNTGIPGTGIYSRKKLFGKSNSRAKSKQAARPTYAQPVPIRTRAANRAWGMVFVLLGIGIIILACEYPLVMFGRILIGAIGAFTLLSSLAFFTAKSVEDYAEKPTIHKAKAAAATATPPRSKISDVCDARSAEVAFRAILANLGLASTVEEVLDLALKATKCLSYATNPSKDIWGTENILDLYKKLDNCKDTALIRIATNARARGDNYENIKALIKTDTAKSVWEATFE